MVTILKAYEIARSYAKERGEVLPGIYFDVEDGIEYSNCYYFDYMIVDKNGNVPDAHPLIAGAVGIIVDKHSEKAEDISFGRFSELK